MKDKRAKIKEAKAGDVDAMGALIVSLMPLIHKTVNSIISGHYHDRQDATQEAMIAIMMNIDEFNAKRDTFETWATFVANNEVRKAKRREFRWREKYKGKVVREPATYEDGSRILTKRMLSKLLNQAIDSLPEANQLIIRQYYIKGNTDAYIGSTLDLTAREVRYVRDESLIKLKRLLVAKGVESWDG